MTSLVRPPLKTAGAAVLVTLAVGQLTSQPRDRIVFVCHRSGADNICLTDVSGSEIQQVTTAKDGTSAMGGPRWTRDRQKIAFHQRAGNTTDVYVMAADGSTVRQVTRSDGSISYRNPAWSPDGSRLALECGGGNVWDICILATDGSGLGKVTEATTSGGNSESPDWSPDGTRIAFHSNRDATPFGPRAFRGADIYVMNLDGSQVRRLTTTPPGRTTQNPAWSPDGRQIAFASTRDGDSLSTDWQLYVMAPDGAAVQQLTHDHSPFAFGHPRWSPDGRWFVFHSNRDGTQRTAAEVELYVIGGDGMNRRRITSNDSYDGFADW
jgi:tol-pal system beta propeller repeat protein TolB